MMRAIRINFAPASSARALRSASPLRWCLAALGLVLAALAALTQQRIGQEQAALQADIDAVSARIAARQLRDETRPKALLTPVQAQAMNAVTAQLNTPWSAMLNAVEAAEST